MSEQVASAFGMKPSERVSIFVDGANLYGAYKELKFEMDFKRLLRHFEDHCCFVRGYYYTATNDDSEINPLRPLLDFLDFNGYRVITKQQKEFVNAMGQRRMKGNIDVELTVDLLESAGIIDHAFLFSGDGDYRAAIEAAQRRGMRVTVVSARKNVESPMVADELRRQADRFVELSDVMHLISRPMETGRTQRSV
jgi:uncharacterized LabA/DUF88 family protein